MSDAPATYACRSNQFDDLSARDSPVGGRGALTSSAFDHLLRYFPLFFITCATSCLMQSSTTLLPSKHLSSVSGCGCVHRLSNQRHLFCFGHTMRLRWKFSCNQILVPDAVAMSLKPGKSTQLFFDRNRKSAPNRNAFAIVHGIIIPRIFLLFSYSIFFFAAILAHRSTMSSQ